MVGEKEKERIRVAPSKRNYEKLRGREYIYYYNFIMSLYVAPLCMYYIVFL